MWQNICLKNKDNIVDILDKYIDSLEDSKKLSNVKMIWIFITGLNPPEIIVIPCHLLRPDRSRKHLPYTVTSLMKPVGIAAIATILASNNISIKNIGIVHNREFEEGVLRIEFYDEDSSKRAVGLLQKFRYIVYER